MAKEATAKQPVEPLIEASDGRVYRRGRDGKLTEAFDPVRHAKRLLDAIGAKHTITGVRLADPDNASGAGVVVTFTPDEAAAIVAAVKAAVKARAGAKV